MTARGSSERTNGTRDGQPNRLAIRPCLWRTVASRCIGMRTDMRHSLPLGHVPRHHWERSRRDGQRSTGTSIHVVLDTLSAMWMCRRRCGYAVGDADVLSTMWMCRRRCGSAVGDVDVPSVMWKCHRRCGNSRIADCQGLVARGGDGSLRVCAVGIQDGNRRRLTSGSVVLCCSGGVSDLCQKASVSAVYVAVSAGTHAPVAVPTSPSIPQRVQFASRGQSRSCSCPAALLPSLQVRP